MLPHVRSRLGWVHLHQVRLLNTFGLPPQLPLPPAGDRALVSMQTVSSRRSHSSVWQANQTACHKLAEKCLLNKARPPLRCCA